MANVTQNPTGVVRAQTSSTRELAVVSFSDDSRSDSSRESSSRDSPSGAATRKIYNRTKTGCITCRKRKKKCDEGKPSCNNCLKNNIVCQGYEGKKDWESGGKIIPVRSTPPLPQIIVGVETPLDRELWRYFTTDLSKALNIYYDYRNPFTDLVMPRAMQYPALMHAVLSLASFCLESRNIETDADLVACHDFHLEMADVEMPTLPSMEQGAADCAVLQTIIHCVETRASPSFLGDYKSKLQYIQQLVLESNYQLSPSVRDFAQLFLTYHNLINLAILQTPANSPATLIIFESEIYQDSPNKLSPGSHYLAFEGLLGPFVLARQIRDMVRHNRGIGQQWLSDPRITEMVFVLDEKLKAWTNHHLYGTQRYYAALLYRDCCWIYLHRTLYEAPNDNLTKSVGEALEHLEQASQAHQDVQNNWFMGSVMPFVFLLGFAAFDSPHRHQILKILVRLQHHSFDNVGRCEKVLRWIWTVMDAGGPTRDAWDWEELAHMARH